MEKNQLCKLDKLRIRSVLLTVRMLWILFLLVKTTKYVCKCHAKYFDKTKVDSYHEIGSGS